MKESKNPGIVMMNKSVTIEGLQSQNRTVDQLRPNTEYVIQTHATYHMTSYNANESLMLYSKIVMQKTDGMLLLMHIIQE